jgi:L-fuconolactonase
MTIISHRLLRLDRREFLRCSGAGLASAALGPFSFCGCRAARPGKCAPAAPIIIDTHTHFYDPTRPQGVPWPPKQSPLYRRVLPQDYLALPVPQPVRGTVVVEASAWLEDNQWILDLADQDPFIVGFVGHLNPGDAEFPGHLKRFAAHRLFRGIRLFHPPLREGLAKSAFIPHLRELAARGLALDVNGPPAMLPGVEQIARAVSDLRIVINHVALPRIDGVAVDPAWRRAVASVAQYPRVAMKVSGLVEASGRHDGTAPRDVEFYRPWLDVLWENFGEDRLIYGSNWPVSEAYADLFTVQRLVTDYFSTRGADALRKVLADNARWAYRWIQR